MTNKELTNKELIDKAIKIISNPRTRFSSSGRWIELKRKGLISRVLSLHSGRTLNLFFERKSYFACSVYGKKEGNCGPPTIIPL